LMSDLHERIARLKSRVMNSAGTTRQEPGPDGAAWAKGIVAAASKAAERAEAKARKATRKKAGGKKRRKETAEEIAAQIAGQKGLPSQPTWVEVQLFDNGLSDKPGHVRWRTKISAIDIDPTSYAHRKSGAQIHRYASLSLPIRFRENFSRKKRTMEPAEATMLSAILADLGDDDLIGFVSCRNVKGRGTIRYAGQVVRLMWPDDAEFPVVRIHLGVDGHYVDVQMRATGNAHARAARFVGTWYAPAYQAKLARNRHADVVAADEVLA
jgi:hypothetical protein